jgi:hypothetical protein
MTMRRCRIPWLLASVFVVVSALPVCTAQWDAVDDLLREAAAGAQRGDAAAILRAVRLRYRRLRSFSARGETVVHLKAFGGERAIPTTFTVLLARPDRYRIDWTTSAPPAPPASGAAWRTAEGPHAFRTAPPGWALERDDDIAMGVGGIPAGDARIPSLFFKGKGELADIRTPTLEGSEAIEDEECWIISGASVGKSVTVWISQDRLLVVRQRSVLKMGPQEEAALEEEAEKKRHQFDAMMRSKLGLDSDRSAEFRSMMIDTLRAFAQHADALDHSATVTYRNIIVDPPTARADFEFQVPAGIPRRNPLVAGALLRSAASETKNLRPPPPGEEASAILAKVAARYRDLRAFAAEGSLVARTGIAGDDGTLRRTFTLAMQRPGRYRLTWSRDCVTSVDGGVAHTACPPGGALWNDGSGPYEYNGSAYAKQASDHLALAGAVGASGGATTGLPGLFLTGDRWIVDVINPVLEGVEMVDSDECYVISGSSHTSAQRTLWISRDRSLIIQRRDSYAGPRGNVAERQLTEESVLEHMKPAARPEAREEVGFFLDMEKARAKHRDALPGDTTVTYRNIRVDDAVPASELVFAVPEGTPLKVSLSDWFGAEPPAVQAVDGQRDQRPLGAMP